MKALSGSLLLLAFGLFAAGYALTSHAPPSHASTFPIRAYLPQLANDEPRAPAATPTLPASPTTAASPTAAQPTPTATATTAPSTTLTVSSPIARGNMATATVHTSPGASCTISYTTPSGNPSSAAGLVPKSADGAGNVSWTWLISGSTAAGTGSVSVTCAGVTLTKPIVITL